MSRMTDDPENCAAVTAQLGREELIEALEKADAKVAELERAAIAASHAADIVDQIHDERLAKLDAAEAKVRELAAERQAAVLVRIGISTLLKEAEAKLEAIRGLPVKWRETQRRGYILAKGHCADELEALLNQEQ